MPDASVVPPSVPPLTAAASATELTHLARRFGAAFTQLAAAGRPEVGASDAHRMALAQASRLVGLHATAFAELVPESVLLAAARAEGEAAPIDLPVEPTAVLDALDDTVARLAARGRPVADGALLRVAAMVRADLAVVRAAFVAPR